jgi:hypothetical protein
MRKRQAVAVAAPVIVDDESDSENLPQSVLNAKKNPKSSSKKNGRTIEEMYQKKSQLEHILLRPDTYGKISSLPLLTSP